MKAEEIIHLYTIVTEILLPPDNSCKRSIFCTTHRKSLAAMLTCPHKDDKTDPSGHTVYSALNSSEKERRLRLLHE